MDSCSYEKLAKLLSCVRICLIQCGLRLFQQPKWDIQTY
jgi:hypothetical protein